MNKSSSFEPVYKALGDVLLVAFGNTETQQSLARRTHVSQPEIHNWLSGKRRPRPMRLGLLASLLQLTPDEFTVLIELAKYDSNPDAFDKALAAYDGRSD